MEGKSADEPTPAVIGENAFLTPDRFAARTNLLIFSLSLFSRFRTEEIRIAFENNLFPRFFEEMLNRLVRVNVAPEFILYPCCARRVLHKRLKAGLGFPKRVHSMNAGKSASAVAGQDLQELQVGPGIRVDPVTLDRDDSQCTPAFHDGHEEKGSRGVRNISERSQRRIKIVSLPEEALSTILQDCPNKWTWRTGRIRK